MDRGDLDVDAPVARYMMAAGGHCGHPHLADLLDVGDWRESPVP